MYRALYRKWRPQRFDDVVGQGAITTALKNQISADKIGHAYLFTGTRGTGKTTCAKIFAMAVNCENPQEAEPCGACEMCRGLADGSVLDVAEIDAASNNGVDDVRELRDETAFRPSRGRFRVYIIDEVHMLTTQAFNALLKTLEEPPSHVIFVLATTESHKVPATILSRCQRFDFMRIPAEDIAGRLTMVAKAEQIELTEQGADLIARLGDGSMRDALSLLDTCAGGGQAVDEALVRRMAGVADKSYLFQTSDAAWAGDVPALLALVARLRAQSIDVRRLCEELVFHYRNLLLARTAADGSLLESVPLEERARYLAVAGGMREESLIQAIQRLADALDRMGRSPDPRIELELALFDLGEKNRHMPAPQSAPQAETAKGTGAGGAAPAVISRASKPGREQPDGAERTETETREPAVAALPSDAVLSPSGSPLPEAGTAAEGKTVPFAPWAQVLAQMAQVDRMLSSYMADTGAYTDGMKVLIDGGAVFLTYMRENAAARERIKTVIEQVCGKRYGIGPYKGPKQDGPKPLTAQDTLQAWQAQGVCVTTE